MLMGLRSPFSLLLVAGISVSVTGSCDEDVREADEVEELVDNQGQRMVHDLMCRNEFSFRFLMTCRFSPLVQW